MPNLLTMSDKDKLLKCVIYGKAGTRKTTLLGTFPKPFIFDFDHKLDPLFGKDIEFESFDFGDRTSLPSEFAKFLNTFKKVKNDPAFGTLCFDSGTMLDGAILYYIQKKLGKQSAGELPDIALYRNQNDWYNFFFMELMASSLKKHVIMVYHEEWDKDEAGNFQLFTSITGPKMKARLPAYFKEIYHMAIEEGGDKKTIQTLWYKTRGKALANSLVLSGDGCIENPTYDKILERIK